MWQISSGESMALGKWAVIDIETTGVDPSYDDIIDLGYLQFEGTKLVKKYSSLVKTPNTLSQFIQKLTGITESLLKNAPSWTKVEGDLLDLEGHHLIAHNASFEQMFLERYFDGLGSEREPEFFQDSIFFMALLDPNRNSLSLESLIVDYGIAEKEEHRGLSDSIDLLKLMLVCCYEIQTDSTRYQTLLGLCNEFHTEEFWFKNFLKLTQQELLEIADQIEFDLEGVLARRESDSMEDFSGVGSSNYPMDFSGTNIKNILQDEKNIQKRLSSYRYRESQEKLSLRVGQAFTNGIHALIQAPTGTGKTLGYLIPSILNAKANGQQVLISTGTKALQNQAMTKDIPLAMEILGMGPEKLQILRLVGSKNHFCELMFRNDLREKDSLLDTRTFDEKFTEAFFEMVFFLNQNQADYNSIISADSIPHVLRRKVDTFTEQSKNLRVDYKACTGNKCPFKNECTYIGGLRRAKEADLIVGNHALLLTWPRSLEKPQYIVIDEAHKIESESTHMFTQELNQKELESFGKNMPQMVAPLYYLLGSLENGSDKTSFIKREIASSAKLIAENVETLKDLIERFAKKLPRFTDVYWNEFPMIIESKMNAKLEVSLFNQIDSLRYIFKGIYDVVFPLVGRWNVNSLNDENEITAFTLFESFCSHIEESLSTLNNLLDNQVDRAGSIKYHAEYGFLLSSAPINVGELFYESVIKPSESVIFTSATLANNDGSRGMAQVEWMTGYNLLPAEKRFRTGLFLDNNYDYENNAKVFVSTDTPVMYDKNYVESIMDELVPLIKDLGGRSLLLFSSRVRFDKACELMLKAFEGEIPLFIQGLGINVVEDFKKSSQGILIGMESFGEGIDIPGSLLEFVYIDKVPDLRQDLVIQKRRDFYDAEFGNEFNDYFLAHRTRSLHQKLGRLIRRESDKGCIIITDARLARWKGKTLDTFKDMMKPYQLNFIPFKEACSRTKDFLVDN